jgi:hypothetical protein
VGVKGVKQLRRAAERLEVGVTLDENLQLAQNIRIGSKKQTTDVDGLLGVTVEEIIEGFQLASVDEANGESGDMGGAVHESV